MSIVPTDNDVLFGRGPAISAHPGNVKLRVKVTPHKRRFQNSNKRKEKQSIANSIIDEYHKSRGRFLMEDPDHAAAKSKVPLLDRHWIVADRDRVMKKVNHILREKDKGGDDEYELLPMPREEESTPSSQNVALQSISSSLGVGNINPLYANGLGGGMASAFPLNNLLGSMPNSMITQQSITNPLVVPPPFNQPVPAASLQMGSAVAGQLVQHSNGEESAVSSSNSVLQSFSSSLGPGNINGLHWNLGGRRVSDLHSDVPGSMNAEQSIGNQQISKSDAYRPIGTMNGQEKSPSVAAAQGTANGQHVHHSSPDNLAGSIGCASVVAPANSISLRDWKKAAREVPVENAYIRALGTVELAWMLAKHLSDLVDSQTRMNAQGINTECVLVLVEHSPRDDSQPSYPTIREVKLMPSLFDAEIVVPEPRHVCAALGRILVDVFGLDQTSLNVSLKSDHDSNDEMPPAPKRQAMAPANGSAYMPLSIIRLVRDLLHAENEQRRPSDDEQNHSVAITSLEEVLWELSQMKSHPESFLSEQTCPEKALDHFHSLDENLFGRDEELATLVKAKNNVAAFVGDNNKASSSLEGSDFVCEAAFVGGYAGSGKSTLLLPLMEACVEEKWFVLSCKFDKQAAATKVLVNTFNDFFGKWGGADVDSSSPMLESFRKVCGRIIAAIDDDGFDQLADLVPNFTRLFPLVAKRINSRDEGGGISSMDKVGSAQKRLQQLIHVVVGSICSAGRPVLLALDDLQWCDTFVLEGLTDYVTNYLHQSGSGDSCRRGFFVTGTYRSNEVQEGGSLIKSVNAIKESRQANVTMLTTGELSKTDVTKLISAKLCLPWRYTRDLADVVQSKTRGNPFFVIQFLRSIVSNKMLDFSVRSRRWIWDCDVVDMQMISDGVAGLLAALFNQLPPQLTKTMKIVSCLGYQVERPTINALDSTKEVLSFRMLDQMELAVKEGILERAGPVYQFTHDIVQQSIYELIPPQTRGPLHKTIGQGLLKSAADNPTIHLLTADQINMFCKDATPSSPEERALFARSNATAAKLAIADSSFERARLYIDMGIRLLEPNHWEIQYPLSLELYEMSASVSCISGDISTMSTCLQAVLSHVMAFEDSLKASSMLVKLLASNSKYDDARSNCLDILKKLGEEFPSEVSLPLVKKELPELLKVLRSITYDRIKALLVMTDKRKLNAMKFLNMLCMCCTASKPLLLPFLSLRMVQLTLQHGFCDDSIVGIAIAGFSVYLFTDDLQLAVSLGKVSELLVDESSKKHLLRARLCIELYTQLKLLREPWPSVVTLFPELYNSAMLVGDVGNALICRSNHSGVGYWSGTMSLSTISEQSLLLMKKAAKYQQYTTVYNAMMVSQSCMHLTGASINVDIEIKSLDELAAIGEETNDTYLVWQTFMHKMSNLFWSRDFLAAAELSEKYAVKHHSALQQKRILHVIRIFYEGIAYLNLARGPGDAKKKWREMGEKAVATLTGYVTSMSKWNFENKSLLLQAELQYLNGDLDAAAAMYEASIKSACENKFINEEALAYELHGRFCIENNRAEKGSYQLRVAVGKYNEWGATKKANDVQLYLGSLLA